MRFILETMGTWLKEVLFVMTLFPILLAEIGLNWVWKLEWLLLDGIWKLGWLLIDCTGWLWVDLYGYWTLVDIFGNGYKYLI